jgi:hypothetical protein
MIAMGSAEQVLMFAIIVHATAKHWLTTLLLLLLLLLPSATAACHIEVLRVENEAPPTSWALRCINRSNLSDSARELGIRHNDS